NADRYAAAAKQLARVSSVYGCTCTRAALGPADESGERNYLGRCRGMPRDRGEPASWRVHLPDESAQTQDLLLGELRQHPAVEGGDVVIRDARGQWSYQLCVVVDDIRHGIDLIVRGEDLATSTGRQQLLAEMLGRSAPAVTLHHPLVLAPDGRKLSKRDRSETVASMRERGMTADDVVAAAMKHVNKS
ncbi:MAG: tRNA glutamyl-Q(34) synthetase GluQRS, partial [Gemmatimonadales bacterium]|nr:tRNA glutamyl-Q(34) synthetase GluQRS [Gemmatimonadales bacterium]